MVVQNMLVVQPGSHLHYTAFAAAFAPTTPSRQFGHSPASRDCVAGWLALSDCKTCMYFEQESLRLRTLINYGKADRIQG